MTIKEELLLRLIFIFFVLFISSHLWLAEPEYLMIILPMVLGIVFLSLFLIEDKK